MAEGFEEKYDAFLEDMKRMLPKVDPNFANRMMYLERKLAGQSQEDPHAVLTIEYTEGTDMDARLAELRDRYHMQASYTDNHHILFGMGNMRLSTVAEISRDQSIIRISGKASPVVKT